MSAMMKRIGAGLAVLAVAATPTLAGPAAPGAFAANPVVGQGPMLVRDFSRRALAAGVVAGSVGGTVVIEDRRYYPYPYYGYFGRYDPQPWPDCRRVRERSGRIAWRCH